MQRGRRKLVKEGQMRKRKSAKGRMQRGRKKLLTEGQMRERQRCNAEGEDEASEKTNERVRDKGGMQRG